MNPDYFTIKFDRKLYKYKVITKPGPYFDDIDIHQLTILFIRFEWVYL